VGCWKWSDASVEEARRLADARALELGRMMAEGRPLNHYMYGEQPLREEAIRIVQPEMAVITRNLYGALVLNAARAMFIDVDFGEAKGPGFMGRLFGKSSYSSEEVALGRVLEWSSRHRDLGLRVYRTCAGLRCLVTNCPFDPASATALDLLREIGSDPLYVRLCQAQGCFRARLTPKPWRCGGYMPPGRFPRTNQQEQARFQEWLTDYERRSAGYGVCRFAEHLGPTDIHPELQWILKAHDEVACGSPGGTLA
jgi:hypothetical protein